MRLWFRSFCFLMLGLLVGCGFQLRGTQGYDFDLDNIYLSSVNARGEMMQILGDTLSNQGVEIVSKSDARYSLALLSENTHRRPVATSGDISVSEYELVMEVQFQVLSQNQERLIPPTSVVVEKIYSFDAASLVGSSEEEKLVIEEIRRDISGQILRRVYAALRVESEKR